MRRVIAAQRVAEQQTRTNGAGRSSKALTLWLSHDVAPEQTRVGYSVRADSVTTTKHPIEIDLSVIEDLADGDAAVVAELIETFVRHTADGIGKVQAAIGAGQLAEAARAAHTCIGFTATLGITALAPTLRELERAIRDERREEMTRLAAQWEREFEQVRQTLAALLNRAAG
jgi:HPt (histidine-containing phosphotransfer) domain-containing protein